MDYLIRQIRECYLEAFKHTFGGKQPHKNSENPFMAPSERVRRHSSWEDVVGVVTVILTALGDLPVMLIKSSRSFCKS